MRIAFVQNFLHEYVGIMSIAAVVKKGGHQACVFISPREKDLIGAVGRYNPDVIAFPAYSGSQGWVFKMALKLKKRTGKLIVVGGPHATFFPEIIKEESVDIVCRGEGEYPMLDLLNALERKQKIDKIKNLWVKKDNKIIKNPLRRLIDPLDRLPYLDRKVYYRDKFLAQNKIKYFNIGRGCPYQCSYCHNVGLAKIYQGKGCYVRHHHPERVLEEIDRVKEKYPLKVVHFIDDTYVTKKAWLDKFLPLYKKQIGLPFVCNIKAELLDEDLAKNLARAGCISLFMGVETGREKTRLELLKKTGVTDKELKRAARLIHKYKIQLATNNMIGLPGESLEEAFETIRFNTSIKTDLPWCSIFQPYPGTELADYCLKKGYVRKEDINKIGASFLNRSILKNPDMRELINLQKFFHLGVKFPFLLPLIKILIKLPLTFLYDYIFLANQGLTYMKYYHLNWLDFIPQIRQFGRLYLKSLDYDKA